MIVAYDRVRITKRHGFLRRRDNRVGKVAAIDHGQYTGKPVYVVMCEPLGPPPDSNRFSDMARWIDEQAFVAVFENEIEKIPA